MGFEEMNTNKYV